jgi:excisionase family DNA binding protein
LDPSGCRSLAFVAERVRSRLLAARSPTGDECATGFPRLRQRPVAVATVLTRLADSAPSGALARLRQAEATMVFELAAVREAIIQLEAVLICSPPSSSLLTVAEAARELRVSRSRVFDLLRDGELEGVLIGRGRCVTRRSMDDFLARLGAA